ncbi:hypothetical protein ACWA5Z_00935 [Testudinibacter sp. P80/BLE/0925]|uniref:hypothetical protein n=1 Tax=Testudinibacter sp. TW-1 TaxID=3417757 RepID=UPI003D363E83
MTKPVLFFAHLCPDTEPFIAELNALKVAYESVNIFESMANFKRFLKLRDSDRTFDEAKQNGYVGIPALLLANGEIILELNELKRRFG